MDEAQKIPQVLDEVHWLIENRGLRFILCGSSARKLKRGRANLLGGRAWRLEMFPLVTAELDYNLNFWRTKSGMEVDFVLADGEVAIEANGTSRVDNRDIASIISFNEKYSPRRAIVVCNEEAPRRHRHIELLPYRLFLEQLWGGEILAV